MRCPHCAGEILDESRFCGICGRAVVVARGHQSPADDAAAPAAPAVSAGGAVASTGAVSGAARPRGDAAEAPPVAIELPVSRGARWARILAVLALDVVMAGVGLALILSYARSCDQARGVPAASPMGDALEGSK